MDYDYSLIPPKCPHCRAMPVNDETPKWMIREYGSCYCEEEAVDIELFKFTLRMALFATTNPETKAAEMERATAMAAQLTEAEVVGVIAEIKTEDYFKKTILACLLCLEVSPGDTLANITQSITRRTS